jgi:small subunit ribosomal protein S18
MPPPSRKRPTTKVSDQRSRPGRGKPKVCIFCADRAEWVDYKDTNLLRRFLSDRGKIRSRGNTGTCAQHQRDVATAIKTARELALLPYAVRTLAADKPGGRGRGGGRGGPRPGADVAAAVATTAAGAEGDGDDAEDVTEDVAQTESV